MATRNTSKLRELIQTTLTDDTGVGSLEALLGSSGRIINGNPNNVAEYPCVSWQILGGEDEPYNPNIETGIERSYLVVEVFGNTENPDALGPIEDRVYSLLHGQILSNSDIRVYSCQRTSTENIYEPEVRVWRLVSKYNLVNSPI